MKATARSEEPFARPQRLHQFTAALASAVSKEEVFEAVVDRLCEAVGASSAALWLVDAESSHARLARACGYSDVARERISAIALDTVPSIPAVDAIRDRAPVWVASKSALLVRYPHLRGIASADREYGVACLPLIAAGSGVLGAIGLTVTEADALGRETREFLVSVASYATHALERLRLLDQERESHRKADAAAHRLGVLARASRAFDSELGVPDRLTAVAHQLSEALGSCINVGLIEADGHLRLSHVCHPDPEAQRALRALTQEAPVRVGEGVTGTIAATGESVRVPRIDPADVEARAVPAYRAFLARFPVYAMMGAALRVRGRIIGTVTATRCQPGQTYTADDLQLLEELADRAAIAIDNARLLTESQAARRRAELVYGFATAAVQAEDLGRVYDAALDSISAALGADRAAVLTADAEGVMRFRAWRGLSDAYRAAVDGHSPWPRDAVAPQPVLVPDAAADPGLQSYRALFAAEEIGALAFIPLVSGGKLLGKFMVYDRGPRAFSAADVSTATALASHLASLLTRFSVIDQLEQTLRANELFTAVLAHDLRNPLSAIISSAQVLTGRLTADADRKTMARIAGSGQRMGAMVDQLLDVARIRSSRGLAVQRAPAELAELAQQAIDELALAHPEWQIRLSANGDSRGHFDAVRLTQVCSNLVANAGHHGAGGPVTVAIDGTAIEAVRLTVHNQGTIGADVLPHVFDPFRAERPAPTARRGLGLGLYIVRALVEAHGGTVALTSTDADGTQVVVALPR